MDKDTKNEVVGKPFEELSEAEMVESQGSGDVSQETTPLCLTIATVAGTIAITKIINK